MDKAKIISFIKQNKGAEIAGLQREFNASYKGVKDIIDEMVSKGDLVLAEGVRYNYVSKPEGSKKQYRSRTDSRRRTQREDDDDDDRPKYGSLRAYFEARRKELEQSEGADDDEDDENDDDTDEDGIAEDELRKKALKLCIERGVASVSLFQRTFPIGYVRACNLVDWMEEQGYISGANGPWSRRVLITEGQYEELYPEERNGDDEAGYRHSVFEDLFGVADDNEKHASEPVNREEQKPALQSLVNIFNAIAENKKAPVSADVIPQHDLWTDDREFTEAVMERMKSLIRSDVRMGRQGAVNKAETYLEAVRDTHDMKMVQVYERLVYELKNTSNYLYVQLKKQFCDN